MSTYEMLVKSIEVKRNRNSLTIDAKSDIETKMDVFLLNDRITQEEYKRLIFELDK